jgi:hypothetical protein
MIYFLLNIAPSVINETKVLIRLLFVAFFLVCRHLLTIIVFN